MGSIVNRGENGIVTAVFPGVVTREVADTFVAEINAEISHSENNNVLTNAERVLQLPSAGVIRTVAEGIKNHRPRITKSAVVVNNKVIRKAFQVGLLISNRYDVKLFVSEKEAMEWLLSDECTGPAEDEGMHDLLEELIDVSQEKPVTAPATQRPDSIGVSKPGQGSGLSKTLLMIEDNASIAVIYKRIIENKLDNTTVLIAETAREAFEKLSVTKIDLILCDLILPEMSGLEVIQRIRADERLKRIPIVVISAMHSKDAVLEAKNLGVDDYLLKPASQQTLLSRISSFLNYSR